MIGGDSQQEVHIYPLYHLILKTFCTVYTLFSVWSQALPTLLALQQEHDALNKALRAEQQLYSSLVRTVKEQDR